MLFTSQVSALQRGMQGKLWALCFDEHEIQCRLPPGCLDCNAVCRASSGHALLAGLRGIWSLKGDLRGASCGGGRHAQVVHHPLGRQATLPDWDVAMCSASLRA